MLSSVAFAHAAEVIASLKRSLHSSGREELVTVESMPQVWRGGGRTDMWLGPLGYPRLVISTPMRDMYIFTARAEIDDD